MKQLQVLAAEEEEMTTMLYVRNESTSFATVTIDAPAGSTIRIHSINGIAKFAASNNEPNNMFVMIQSNYPSEPQFPIHEAAKTFLGGSIGRYRSIHLEYPEGLPFGEYANEIPGQQDAAHVDGQLTVNLQCNTEAGMTLPTYVSLTVIYSLEY